jgi:hypothetical protein
MAGTTTDSTSNKPQEKQGTHSREKRQHIKGANGVSEQRQERTNGNIEERRQRKKLRRQGRYQEAETGN